MRIALVEQHVTRDQSDKVARGLAAFESAARHGVHVVGSAELVVEWIAPVAEPHRG